MAPSIKQAEYLIVRTNSEDPHFRDLVAQLDAELARRDGEEHSFYAQFNKIHMIRHAVLVYNNQEPISCGAIKEFKPGTMEVKRMYTLPAFRGQGLAAKVLNELENWATELGYRTCVLETGKRQPEAIALYTKCGYKVIENYGQYEGIENSVCFQKQLNTLVP